jgi:Protein kinase domain
MPENDRLLDLVVLWEELHEAGKPISIEELCLDCPDLLPALRKRLKALGALDAMLANETNAGAATVVKDGNPTGNRHTSRVETLPVIPGYEIIRELGRGGMGVVYEARQERLNRLVAVKVLLGGQYATVTSQARFKAEVDAIGRMQHPNLIQVFDVGEYDGRLYYSMEYLAGGSLEDRIGSVPLSTRKAAELLKILADAIKAVHRHGVIHRDLKPANILLTTTDTTNECWGIPGFGTPKISDFGLAKRTDVTSGPTLTEHILGTPTYMAPEQAAGQSRQVGPATDIYSLGAILYRLLIGRPPFVGESVMEIVRQVADADPIPPRYLQPAIPIDLETICLKCLDKQPAKRYENAAALSEDLRRFLENEPILARPIGWFGRLGKWVRRRPAVASLIGVCGVALLALFAAGWFFHLRLAEELRNTRAEQQKAEAAGHQLKLALAGEIAAALNADFKQLEIVPQSMVALLSLRTEWDEKELENWTKALVKKDARVFGISLAFEPRQFVGSHVYDDYCLYVHEEAGGLVAKQLLPPEYPPPSYRERHWYSVPQTTGSRTWTEPYLGERAHKTPMLTYSCPLYREGEFRGVVATDLSIRYFRELHTQLEKMYLGTDCYSFVISSGGKIMYHPNPHYEFPSENSSLDRIPIDPGFRDMMRKMQQQETGYARGTDFDGGLPATFYFARIPATDGHFVLVQFGPTPPAGLDSSKNQ